MKYHAGLTRLFWGPLISRRHLLAFVLDKFKDVLGNVTVKLC